MSEPAVHIGRYRVIAAVGAGAMGSVVRARDERLGRDVAIKRVRNLSGVAAPLFLARFEAEARALAALSHPGVVAVYDLGVDGDEPYLVMELLEGGSLRDEVNRRGALPLTEVAALGIQVARALEAAHARGILHRDVKPANLVRGGDGPWKLVDFGVAHTPDSDVTLAGQFVGTPSYAAPEALTQGRFSPASDVFGLAATMVEIATGARPRADLTLADVIAHADRSLLDAGARHKLGALIGPIERALAVIPEHRPTAGELAEALALAGTDAIDVATTGATPLAAPTTAVATAAAAGLSRAGATVNLGAPPSLPSLPWRKIGVGAAALLGFGLLVAMATCEDGGDGPRPSPARFEDGARRFDAPADLDGRAARDWRKIADKVHDGDLRGARGKLREFERKHGASPESRALAAWLEAQD